ncbi:nucleotidyltransferase domain-containing protein [Salicibibacter kimchii]|uniref:Nucleotidyltransferase domain-containing protein n=1 Tax=Salicibibacter kimchii TaxID=2099786 RepID=A0A345C0M1_9BACI|nr:nucleotidyltransferase domain-containing protein [Salicibibacter kimchii]AXF56752.1 nucleotidyltransferase domain-containing protein [Salicibibacter kimchii]
MPMPARTAAEHFIQQTFPHCDVAFLGGSGAQKELTKHSDLDIVILDSTQPSAFYQCFFAFGWNIETFVYHRVSLSMAFATSCFEGIPSILRMCAEGMVLKDDGSATAIQAEAQERTRQVPSLWADEKHQEMRFMITDLLGDLNDSTCDKEKIFVAYKLFALVSEFVLRANGYWIGQGKWMYRSLLHFDPDFCDRYLEFFRHFMKTGEYKPFYTLIEEVLEQHGGRLFAGGYQKPL